MFHRASLSALILVGSCGLANAQGPAPVPSEPGKQVAPAGKPTKIGRPSLAKPAAENVADLKVGSPAPALTVDKWVKGDEVTGFEKGKVYVVEFWATWCPPCRESIPHLTELQKKHKDVPFIGVAASERQPKGTKPTDKADARLEKLEKFVKDKGDEMGYAVAYDSKATMVKTWTMPAHQSGIPVAFIVGKDGAIAWIGHPMSMESALDKAIAKPAPAAEPAANPATESPADANAPTTKADPKVVPAPGLPGKLKKNPR